MRFHVLGLPHTVSSKEFNACAYTQKVVKFCKMMSARGHYIIHYGHEDSDVICNEHVSVITNNDWEIAYGDYDWRKNFFKFDVEDHAYKTFYKNAIEEVGKRKEPLDFILPFWGSGVRPICDAHQDMICVEPGIGYAGGHWARWKIFESYAIYHAYCGLNNVGFCNQDWYEVVIPNYFDLDDFDYSEEKDDYFLFLGRVFSGKGIDIAVQMTEKIGAKLIVAGQNPDNTTFPDHVEYIGYADVETRRRLLSRAKGFIIGSMYVEPFGGVQVEALLSGTPTITTDWGAFTENNVQGVTGYRCRTFEDFVNAGKNIDKIKPSDCRKFAEKFSLENVALMYEKYFQDVLNVHTNEGWYHIKTINKGEIKVPFSDNVFDEKLKEHIVKINPRTTLDVGSGAGKIGTICKNILPNSIIESIESTTEYVEKYELNKKYDKVYNLTVQDYVNQHASNRYDLVIFGDILENFFRSEAMDYLDYFLYRSKWVIAVWPTNLPQDAWEGNHFEIHKSNFKISELTEKFDVYHYEKKFGWYNWNNSEYRKCDFNYCVLKGYLTKRDASL
jgi:glycosyltransferase involved in cell wall biosynthesis